MTAVIWIDWYAYHIARFRALAEHRQLKGKVSGIELVGGCGVHAGLKFREDDRAGLPITSLMPAADWQTAGQARLALAVWKKLQMLRPSAVLSPGYYTVPSLTAALWARTHRKRSVLMSETTRDDHRRVWWKELTKRLMVRALFDWGIAGGKPHVRYLQQLGFPLQRIARFYDVVDNRFYQIEAAQARRSPALARQTGLPENYFLYVGRFAPEKGLDRLLEAFARYVEAGGVWSLVMVGDGPQRKELEQQSAALGLSNRVQFAGLKNTRETTVYYAFASCFVLPSVREPWGLVVNEAMASGLPVLVSERCGCAEDLVEQGRNGFVFNPERGEELTNRMLSIGSSSQKALQAMGEKSREIIAGFSPEKWASEVARIVIER